ncbi:MAG: hypothetical protein VX012_10445 [Planctomycetota bacterium]|nr:hypothetical protein [Planctomycetota bacterium]
MTIVLGVAAANSGSHAERLPVPPDRIGRIHRVVDETMTVIEGDPLLIDESMVVVHAEGEDERFSRPIDDVVFLIVGPGHSRDLVVSDRMAATRAGDDVPIASPYLELTDGQRIPGSLHPGDRGEPVWRSAWVRDLEFDLDRIGALRLVPGTRVPEAVDEDVLVLTNGDRLNGLMLEVGNEVVIEVERPGRDPETVGVPIDRVAAVSLVNPVVPRRGTMTWLRGGHRIGSESIRIGDDGYLRLQDPAVGGDTVEIPVEFLMGVAMDAARITPLSSLEIVVEPGPAAGIRPWIPEASVAVGHHPLDAAPVRLDGPLAAKIVLPSPGLRLVATLERPIDAGPGSCRVRILDGDVVEEEFVVDAADPLHRIDTSISGDRITIEIDDHGDGPFNDSIVLREAFVIGPRS